MASALIVSTPALDAAFVFGIRHHTADFRLPADPA